MNLLRKIYILSVSLAVLWIAFLGCAPRKHICHRPTLTSEQALAYFMDQIQSYSLKLPQVENCPMVLRTRLHEDIPEYAMIVYKLNHEDADLRWEEILAYQDALSRYYRTKPVHHFRTEQLPAHIIPCEGVDCETVEGDCRVELTVSRVYDFMSPTFVQIEVRHWTRSHEGEWRLFDDPGLWIIISDENYLRVVQIFP
jgi:hypothetical protein